MARLRAREVPSPSVPVVGAPAGSLHTTQAATDLSQLLRAHAFCLSGDAALLARVAANLQATRGRVEDEAAAWIGLGVPPEGRLSVSLGEHVGALGPYSYGFLNNVEVGAPLVTVFHDEPAPMTRLLPTRMRHGREPVIVTD